MIEASRRSTPQPSGQPAHRFGPWRPVVARTCIDCGLCVDICPEDVFFFDVGRRHLAAPRAEACVGPERCGLCVPTCPASAITIEPSPTWACLGDTYWTNAMIVSTWGAGAQGALYPEDLVTAGTSGAGFDRLGLVAPEGVPLPIPDSVSLRVPLHHRGRDVWIDFPLVMGLLRKPLRVAQPQGRPPDAALPLARAMAARALGTLTAVTADEWSPALLPYSETLVCTLAEAGGIGGRGADVDETFLAHARAVALRYPSATAGSVGALDALRGRLDWLRAVAPEALLMVEINPSADVAQVAASAAHAGAHVIMLCVRHPIASGAGMPLTHAIHAAHRHLLAEGLRDQVALIAGGGVRNPLDVLKAVALGADAAAIAAALVIALGFAPTPRAGGWAGGPHTMDAAWAAQRMVNMALAWAVEQRRALALLGLADVRALRGRTDLLAWVGA